MALQLLLSLRGTRCAFGGDPNLAMKLLASRVGFVGFIDRVFPLLFCFVSSCGLQGPTKNTVYEGVVNVATAGFRR